MTAASCSYTVEGSGPFPFDMLRRDRAFPATTDDACRLAEDGKRRVRLEAPDSARPNADRWRSFGWNVIGCTEHSTRMGRTREERSGIDVVSANLVLDGKPHEIRVGAAA